MKASESGVFDRVPGPNSFTNVNWDELKADVTTMIRSHGYQILAVLDSVAASESKPVTEFDVCWNLKRKINFEKPLF